MSFTAKIFAVSDQYPELEIQCHLKNANHDGRGVENGKKTVADHLCALRDLSALSVEPDRDVDRGIPPARQLHEAPMLDRQMTAM